MKYKILITLLILSFLIGCGSNLQQTPNSTIEAFLENIQKLNEKSPTTIGQAKKLLRTLFATEKAYEAFTTTFRNIKIESYSIGEPMVSGKYTAPAEVPTLESLPAVENPVEMQQIIDFLAQSEVNRNIYKVHQYRLRNVIQIMTCYKFTNPKFF